MAMELRKTGISVVGDVPWGTHFCYFYETTQDLLDILVSYFMAGLESKEFCLWVVSNSELITVEEAKGALAQAVPDLDRHLSDENIEILNGLDWYLEENVCNLERVTSAWDAKLKRALALGYNGMRVSADTFWLEEKDWKDFCAYEKQLNDSITNRPMTVLCTYPLAKSGAAEILDVVQTHHFAIARRQGEWKVIETPQLIQAKAEIKRRNEELEQRVIERTKKLEATSERLRAEIAERKNRETELRRISRALRLVSRSNLTLVRLTDETTVLNEVCRIAVDVGGYRMAWIGFAEQDERKTVRPAAQAGIEAGYLESANLTWADEPHGRGPGGIAIRTGQPSVARNIPGDAAFGPWRAAAIQRGYQSSIALPLRSEGRTFGFLAIYAGEADAFDAEEVKVLTELANDLAFGLNVLRIRAERKQAEEKLKQSESRLAEAQRLAHVGSRDRDLRSNTVTWSDELYRIFGLQPGEIDVAHAISFIHPEDRDLVRSSIESSVKNKEPYSFYYRVLRRDGDERILHSHGYIVSDEHGEPIREFGATQDVTELKRAEEKLKATSEQLRALSASLESAREEEGIRIARELHDELGATLSSLRWDLEDVVEVISESTDLSQFAGLQQRIEAMIELTDTTVNAVRRIVSELRPIALDELGLTEAIEWQAQQFQARSGIICRCGCSLEHVELKQEHSTAVFRIFQEALTNILRHAQATEVDITMKEEDGELVLTISDNGRGITEKEKSGQSLGLLGMRERAHLIGGKIDITGSDGKGTVVTVRIPISG
jgi:PAS domain S-box-containing protein